MATKQQVVSSEWGPLHNAISKGLWPSHGLPICANSNA